MKKRVYIELNGDRLEFVKNLAKQDGVSINEELRQMLFTELDGLMYRMGVHMENY